MKLIFGVSLLVAVTGRPRDKHAEYVQPSSKLTGHTAQFGGTFNFAKKQDNTHSSISDHSKYEVYEPEEHGKYPIADHTGGGETGSRDEHGKRKEYYGRYGSGAQREHEENKHRGSGNVQYGEVGSYVYIDSEYNKESGDAYGQAPSGNHGSLGGYQGSEEKEGSRGTGYYVTERQNDHKTKLFGDTQEYHKLGGEENKGLGDFALKKQQESNIRKPVGYFKNYDYENRKGHDIEERSKIKESEEHSQTSEKQENLKPHAEENTNVKGYITVEKQDHDANSDGQQDTQIYGISGSKGESRGLGNYASGNHEDYKVQQSSSTGEYKTHEDDSHKAAHQDEIRSETREGRGLGEYAGVEHEGVKRGGKSSGSIGVYGARESEAHRGSGVGSQEEGGLGSYASGTYHVNKDEDNERTKTGFEQPKYGDGWL